MSDHGMNSHRGLPGPEDILRRELPNGIVVLSRSNRTSPSVSVQGFLHAGSLSDPDDKLGLARFTATMLMRGAGTLTFQEIFDRLESAGASLGFGSATHTVSFHGKSLVEDLPMLFELLSDALRFPTFPDEYVERRRAQILASLAIRAQDTADVAGMLFDELAYPGHPYRRPEDGHPETIAAITRQDLVDFHRRFYGPNRLVIAVTGGIEPERAVDLAQDALGGWQNSEQPGPFVLPEVPRLTQTVTRRSTIPGKSQADLVIGAPGPRRKSEDFFPASLGNNILGQFGLMGRIGESVREKAGLAYYAGSSLNAGIGPGPWSVAAGVGPQNVERAIELILGEIGRFVSEPVTAEELADTQANYIGRLPLSLESNGGMGAALLNLERYQLGLDYYLGYVDRIRGVSPEQILDTARRYLHPDRMAIAIAGP